MFFLLVYLALTLCGLVHFLITPNPTTLAAGQQQWEVKKEYCNHIWDLNTQYVNSSVPLFSKIIFGVQISLVSGKQALRGYNIIPA